MKTTLSLVTILLLVAGCGSTGDETAKKPSETSESVASVIDPIKGLEIKPREFTVSATAASTIELPNGGKISFPENAFVDASGNPVKGTVTIEWQEYHSLSDIMLSGIPMWYDSAGVSNTFVSGGMFTIDGHQNGKPVEIAEGKDATVALATYDERRQYNFYALDDQTGKWSYETTALSTPNPDVKQGTSAPADQTKKEHGAIFLNVEATTDSVPELARKDIIGWNVSTDQVPKKLQKTITQMAWNARVTGKSAALYNLELSNKGQTIRLKATPVTMDDAIDNTAKVEERSGQRWADLMAFQQQEKEANMIRTASIPGFGTYNWDIIHKREQPIEFVLNLELPDGRSIDAAQIYHVCPDEQSIVRYDKETFEKFSFDPRKGNCIIAIMPDKSIYTVSDKQFDAARKQKSTQEFTFDMNSRKDRFTDGGKLGRLTEELI